VKLLGLVVFLAVSWGGEALILIEAIRVAG
jgi:hypothetical protein